VRVDLVNRFHQLVNVLFGVLQIESFVFTIGKQRIAVTLLQHKNDLRFSLEMVVQRQDVGVVQIVHYGYFKNQLFLKPVDDVFVFLNGFVDGLKRE